MWSQRHEREKRKGGKGHLVAALPPLAVGIVAALLVVGTDGILPTNVGWCCGGDCATHQLGWSFFRASDWNFPLGNNPSYGLELGSSIFYSDSIPLAALLFKSLKALLPSDFQYLGLWAATSIVLQAWFAARLLGELPAAQSPWVRWCALGVFTFAPPLLIRIGGHTALTSHWLILAALALYASPRPLRPVAWPLLALTASLVHSYLFVMTLAIWAAHLARRALAGAAPPSALGGEALLTLSSALLGLWQGGFFAVPMAEASGFGLLAMNVLAPFNPDLYSYVVPPLAPPFHGFHEGYNFLGLGGLVLLAAAMVSALRRPRWIPLRREHWPLVALLAALTLFAISNRVAVGSWRFEVPLPERVIATASVLRSSGRLFWPVFYAVIAASVAVILRRERPPIAAGLLLAASLLQAADTSAGWRSQHAGFARGRGAACPTPLLSAFWARSAQRYCRLRRVPMVHQAKDFSAFARFAAAHGMATDSVYLARIDVDRFLAGQELHQDEILDGNFDPDTLYVLDERRARAAAGSLKRDRDLLARIDGYFVLAPGWKQLEGSEFLADEVRPGDFLAPLPAGGSIAFGAGGEGLPYLTSGWSSPEPWGVWADHRVAELALPVAADVSAVHLDVEVGALVAPGHPQDVECWVNGERAATFQFTAEANTGWRSIPVSPAAVRAAAETQTLRVIFKMLNAQSPKALGLSADVRDLGMTLHRAKLLLR